LSASVTAVVATVIPARAKASASTRTIQLPCASRPYFTFKLASERSLNLSPLLAIFKGQERDCFSLLTHASGSACAMGEV
jgi:hypothetical protein